MSTDPLEYCVEHHDPAGTVGWPVPYEVGDTRPHASVRVCDRTGCHEAASRWVREQTGHDGEFRPFASARTSDAARPIPTPERVACMTCTNKVDRAKAKAQGWLVDEFPTPGGNPIKVVICFPCRQKTGTAEAAERKPCGGTCKGDYNHPDGWRATCTWLGHCEESWSCWDEDCVREWAAEHDEPGECETCHQFTDHHVAVKRIVELQQAVAGGRR